ncbi:MAG: DoxX family protein [Flavobacteriales bacterium]
MTNDLLTSLAAHGIMPIDVMRMAFGAMTAALFLQSGLDKVFNWKGEKAYLTGHFEKSILKGMVPVIMPVITLLELVAGSLSAIGFFQVLFAHGSSIGLLGMVLAVKALFLLFLGQRVAKDYAGAATLVPYFLMCAAGLWVFMAL